MHRGDTGTRGVGCGENDMFVATCQGQSKGRTTYSSSEGASGRCPTAVRLFCLGWMLLLLLCKRRTCRVSKRSVWCAWYRIVCNRKQGDSLGYGPFGSQWQSAKIYNTVASRDLLVMSCGGVTAHRNPFRFSTSTHAQKHRVWMPSRAVNLPKSLD
jgi:hypothetical protein